MELLVIFILVIVGVLVVVRIRKRSRDSQVSHLPEDNNEEAKVDSNDKSFDYGLKMYRVKRFDDAFPVLLHHAEKGHTQACSLVAKMYFAGNGTAKDEAKYQYWMLQAAKGGDKAAKAISKRLAR